MEVEYKDIFGRSLEPGNFVVYAASPSRPGSYGRPDNGYGPVMKTGRVVGYGKNRWGSPRVQIVTVSRTGKKGTWRLENGGRAISVLFTERVMRQQPLDLPGDAWELLCQATKNRELKR